MGALLAIGWTGVGGSAPAPRRLQTLATLAAAMLITAQTGAGLMEQARVDNEPAQAQRSGGGNDASLAPGRETVVGAFTGTPYTYPSPAHIKKGDAVDFT